MKTRMATQKRRQFSMRGSITHRSIRHVIQRGLAHADELEVDRTQLEVDRADVVLLRILFSSG